MRQLPLVFLASLLAVQPSCVKRVSQPQETHQNSKQVVSSKEFAKATGRFSDEQLQQLKPKRVQTEIIYPGDILTISIYEKLPVSQEKRTEIKRVDENGNILILPMGQIPAAGLSLVELRRSIEINLASLVVSPFCEVEITKRGYEPLVFIFGEAGKTGTVPLKQGDRMVDIIAAAGGCKADAYRRSVKVIRTLDSSVAMYSINLYDVLAKGDLAQNMLMQDQDIVFVPRRFYTNLQEVANVIGILLPWYYFVRQLGGL